MQATRPRIANTAVGSTTNRCDSSVRSKQEQLIAPLIAKMDRIEIATPSRERSPSLAARYAILDEGMTAITALAQASHPLPDQTLAIAPVTYPEIRNDRNACSAAYIGASSLATSPVSQASVNQLLALAADIKKTIEESSQRELETARDLKKTLVESTQIETVRADVRMLKYYPNLLDNRDVALIAVRKDAFLLGQFSERLRDDPDVVREALFQMRSNLYPENSASSVFYRATVRLRNDVDYVASLLEFVRDAGHFYRSLPMKTQNELKARNLKSWWW